MATKKIKIEMIFSDESYGVPEYGLLPRHPSRDEDEEDIAYRRHLKNLGLRAGVSDGFVYLIVEE